MPITITAEVQEELLTLVRQELERREQRKDADKMVYRRICENLQDDLDSFTYTKLREAKSRTGEIYQYEASYPGGWRIRDAVGVLLRVVFEVDKTAKLPFEKEGEIREFVGSVLQLMKELKARNLKNQGGQRHDPTASLQSYRSEPLRYLRGAPPPSALPEAS